MLGMADALPPGHDFVVVARPEARALAEREGLAGVRRALAELLER
jgi:ribonuclease P protein component